MAYDGITVAAVVSELNEKLCGGRVVRIIQPEADALVFTLRAPSGQHKLFLSANAALPLLYLCGESKQAPATAPAFCMLLRKYLGSARILGISQIGMDRIIRIDFSHLDELGDERKKTLICELMGKHSNIILIDDKDIIVDAIKRVSSLKSSKREVLPGRPYFVVDADKKRDPRKEREEEFLLGAGSGALIAALCTCYQGLSKQMAAELVRRAGVEERKSASELTAEEREALWQSFSGLMDCVRDGRFSPCIYLKDGEACEFSAIDIGMSGEKTAYGSVSEMLYDYYRLRDERIRIRARSADLRQIVNTALERCAKKLSLQEKQLSDCEGRDELKLCGELLAAYAHEIERGASEYEALNYYDNQKKLIHLDKDLSPQENSARYYARYQKQKRTYEALTEQIKESGRELAQLESIEHALNIAEGEDDLAQIRAELAEGGYIRKKSGDKQKKAKSRPLHFVTEDGFHIYVGKNNYQNDELSFKLAKGSDWWFHAKKMAGSHVIVQSGGRELPDKVYEQAAALAAYYSTAAQQDKAEVDYVQRKELKKPAGSAPGYVVYYTNYSMAVRPGTCGLKELKD